VKRVLDVMSWFYEQRGLLFRLMDKRAEKEIEETTMNVDDDDDDELEYEVSNYFSPAPLRLPKQNHMMLLL